MFDFDGVLADSLVAFHAALDEACRVHGFAGLTDRATFLDIFEGNMVEGLEQAGLAGDQVGPVLVDLGRRLAVSMGSYPPFPGIPEVIRQLYLEGPVYVITSNVTAVVRAYLDRHGMGGVRDVLGSDREASKQVKIRSVMAQWPGYTPYYIGDTLGDMKEARAAGAMAVAAVWGWHDEERLRQGSPDRVVTVPTDLLELLSG
jgi:phosphoglycolate phosphatase